MKDLVGLIVWTVALALFLTGAVWGQYETSKPKTQPKTAAKTAEVKKNDPKKDAAKDKMEADKDKSQAFMIMETRLRELDIRLKTAEMKIASAPAADKPGLQTKMNAVKSKRAAVDPKFKAFKEAPVDKWMPARDEARAAIDATEKEFMSLLASNPMFAKEEKAEYEAESADQMKMYDLKIRDLEAAAAKATGDAKMQADKLLADARAARVEADAQLKKVRDATAEEWKTVKAEADKALKALSDLLK